MSSNPCIYMDYGDEDRQIMATCSCMAAQVKVRERGLRLLWHRSNAGPVCDNSAAVGSGVK